MSLSNQEPQPVQASSTEDLLTELMLRIERYVGDAEDNSDEFKRLQQVKGALINLEQKQLLVNALR